MKTKMKSAFAFIAVALMIMVAVVPMVSVFTEENGVDAAAATEYDNSVVSPIVIEGTIKNNADGLKNVPVTVNYNKADYVVYTNDSGKYTLTTTVAMGNVIDEVKVTVDSATEKVNGLDNGAFGMGFPVVTVNKISKSVGNLDVVAETAKVTGTLVTKSNVTVYISDVSITGAVGAIKTVNGAFSFYGKIGSEYTLSASAVGTQFKAEKFTLGESGETVALKAEKNIATITLATVPMVPTFTPVAATGDNYNGVASLGAAVIGTDDSTDYAYAVINYNATVPAGKNLAETTFNVTYSGFTEEKTTITLSAATDSDGKIVPADDSATSTLSYISKGDMTVGGIVVKPVSVKLTGKWMETSAAGALTEKSKTLTAKIIGNKWYVQNFGGYTVATSTVPSTPISFESTEIVGTHAGYTFNTLSGDGTFAATNAVKVSGAIDAFPTGVYDSVVTVTATNYVSDADGLKLVKAVGTVIEKKTFEFYVPKNTSVTVNAPANYMPSKYVNDKVTADTEIETFVYDSSVEYTTYTGKVTLNGVAISLIGTDLAYSIDGGITFKVFGSTGAVTATFKSNAYSFDLPKTIDAKDVFVKIKQGYTGYKFSESTMVAKGVSAAYYNFYGVTGTTVADIPVKAEEISVTVEDGNTPANVIEGQKVNFYMSKKALAYVVEDKKKVDLGSATTDAEGIASIMAGKVVASDGYKIYAIPEGDATLGAYVFASGIDALVATAKITSTSKTTSGTIITDKGVIVSDPKVSYVEYNATGIVLGEGKAKVVDGKYYIVSKSDVSKVVIKVDGYDLVNDTVAVGSMTADLKDAKAVAPIVVKHNVSYEGSYYNYVNVTTGDFAKGKVITLSAASEFTVEDTENLYADGYTKYTFKAWYVNGKQISTDAITSYTVGDENIVVSADYTSEHVTVADGKQDKDDGVDSNVMIIGIAAVVVALIAVVYAVIQKKE